MLNKSERSGFTAQCDRCRTSVELAEVADDAAARSLLVTRGWLECARKGRRRERWDWWCPRCAPSPPTTRGRTT
jgi:hypothetical protein